MAPKATANSSQIARILWLQQVTVYGKYSFWNLLSAWQPEQTSVEVSEGVRKTKTVSLLASLHDPQRRGSYPITLGYGPGSVGQRGWPVALAILSASWLLQEQRRSISMPVINPGH